MMRYVRCSETPYIVRLSDGSTSGWLWRVRKIVGYVQLKKCQVKYTSVNAIQYNITLLQS